MFTAVKPSRLYEEIVAQISTLISEEKLSPGGKLPSERDLAQRFKVSRVTVREAIRALEHQGMVKWRPGSGSTISISAIGPVIDTFASSIAKERTYIRDIIEVRSLLEPQIASLAAERANAENIQEMEAILQTQEAAIAGYASAKSDHAFHLEMGRATQNDALLRVAIVLGDIFAKTRQKYLQSPERSRYSLESHRDILSAIKNHDPQLARQATQQHVSMVAKYIESSFQG